MRVFEIILVVASSLIAFLASTMTLLVGLSRIANVPPGVESQWWATVFVALVGLVGAVLVFFVPYISTIALGVAAGLSITIIPPENGFLAAFYAIGAALALATYFARSSTKSRVGGAQRSTEA